MIQDKSELIIAEISKAIVGKESVIKKVLMSIYAGGHILLEDVPGVGKTTLALAFSRVLDLRYKRTQFTPDTMPSDIVGFTMYDKSKNSFVYVEGDVVCNLFLGDEINRTSAKTQAALLEAMEEKSVTIDGKTKDLPNPFICIATQNPIGSAGTQPLPNSQLDRFMIRLSIGYPSIEEQISIIKSHTSTLPVDSLNKIVSKDEIVEIQNYLSTIRMSDDIVRYIAVLCERTRNNKYIELGVSPRGSIAIAKMARASAIFDNRDYVIPSDVKDVFVDVCAHRIQLLSKARLENVTAADILNEILFTTESPNLNIK